MTTDSLKGAVKEKVELVKAHVPDVLKTGVETLRAAQGVVKEARRDAEKVLDRTKSKLKRTLKEGVEEIGHKIANLASMTHKEQAEAKKAEVKARKRAKRAQAQGHPTTHDDAAQPAA